MLASRHAITSLRICSFWQRQQQIRVLEKKIRVTGGEKSTRLREGVRQEVRKRKTGFKVPKERIVNCKIWWSIEALHSETKNEMRNIWVQYRLGGAAWGAEGQFVCSEPRQQYYRHIRVCPYYTSLCISMWDCFLCRPCNGSRSSATEPGGRSIKPAHPLRLRVFDQAKVMFTCLATSVAITAIRNRACLVGGETLVLYLNQAKDKRSMAQFRSWIGDKSSQTLWEIMRRRYMSGKEEQRVRGHPAHLGASGLLIGGETQSLGPFITGHSGS